MTDSTIKSLDGHTFDAYIALPSSGYGAGLIVIQEIYGVNAAMRSLCDDFARKGYIAVCPDLYWRQQPNIQIDDRNSDEWPRAFELYKAFDVEAGVRDLLATLAHIRKMSGCNGKVGSIGYGLGGKMSVLMAARSDIDCGVSYYGIGIDSLVPEMPDVRMPLLLHVAEKDKFMSGTGRDRLIRAAQRNEIITSESYPMAEHGFASTNASTYNADAAHKAIVVTDSFLSTWLKT